MHYSDLSNPYERDNELCPHAEPRCQPCERCECEDNQDEDEMALQDVNELVIGR